jgi:hypothetical protein
VAVNSETALLAGERTAIALVVVGGRPRYGERALMEAFGAPSIPLWVDGAERALDLETGRRAASLVKRHPALRCVPWLKDIRFDMDCVLGGDR